MHVDARDEAYHCASETENQKRSIKYIIGEYLLQITGHFRDKWQTSTVACGI